MEDLRIADPVGPELTRCLHRFKVCTSKAKTQLDKIKCKRVYNRCASYLEQLPRNVVIEILKFLPYQQAVTACEVSFNFRKVCKNDSLWRKLLLRDFDFVPNDQSGRKDLWKIF